MLNTTTDVTKYLKSGTLTAPFLDTDSLKVRLKVIEKSLKKKKQDCDEISCIFQFLHSKLEFENENKTLMQQKFSRSAEEIFESRKMTGCTDCAYVFATLARQVGIPTTILQTSQKEWVNKFINGLEGNEKHYGHTFCECFVDGKWVLVDPTNQKIDWKYESENKVIKTEHKIGDSHTFLPYFRGLNLKEMSMKEFLEEENSFVTSLFEKQYNTEEVKKRFDEIKTPEELKKFMDSILTYGFFDVDGVEHLETMKGVEKHVVSTVEQILEYKYETCAEAAKLAKHWFIKNGYDCELYFERIKKHDLDTNEYKNHSTHFYILFKNKDDSWWRFEQSDGSESGIFKLGTHTEAIKHIIKDVEETRKNQIEFNKGKNVEFNTYGIYKIDDIEDGATYRSINKKADMSKNLMDKELDNKLG